MTTQFLTNDKGEKTAVIVPLAEYEDLLHQYHLNLELTDEYKLMIDKMMDEDDKGKATYLDINTIKSEFLGR